MNEFFRGYEESHYPLPPSLLRPILAPPLSTLLQLLLRNAVITITKVLFKNATCSPEAFYQFSHQSPRQLNSNRSESNFCLCKNCTPRFYLYPTELNVETRSLFQFNNSFHHSTCSKLSSSQSTFKIKTSSIFTFSILNLKRNCVLFLDVVHSFDYLHESRPRWLSLILR